MSMSQPSDAEHEWWRVDLVLQTILCPVRFGENITACSGMLIPSGEHIQKSACHNQSVGFYHSTGLLGIPHQVTITMSLSPWLNAGPPEVAIASSENTQEVTSTRGSRLLKASSLAKEHGSCSAWDQPNGLSQLQESQGFLLVK